MWNEHVVQVVWFFFTKSLNWYQCLISCDWTTSEPPIRSQFFPYTHTHKKHRATSVIPIQLDPFHFNEKFKSQQHWVSYSYSNKSKTFSFHYANRFSRKASTLFKTSLWVLFFLYVHWMKMEEESKKKGKMKPKFIIQSVAGELLWFPFLMKCWRNQTKNKKKKIKSFKNTHQMSAGTKKL